MTGASVGNAPGEGGKGKRPPQLRNSRAQRYVTGGNRRDAPVAAVLLTSLLLHRFALLVFVFDDGQFDLDGLLVALVKHLELDDVTGLLAEYH